MGVELHLSLTTTVTRARGALAIYQAATFALGQGSGSAAGRRLGCGAGSDGAGRAADYEPQCASIRKAVRVDDKGGIVGRAVIGAQARLTVVAAAGLQR